MRVRVKIIRRYTLDIQRIFLFHSKLRWVFIVVVRSSETIFRVELSSVKVWVDWSSPYCFTLVRLSDWLSFDWCTCVSAFTFLVNFFLSHQINRQIFIARGAVKNLLNFFYIYFSTLKSHWHFVHKSANFSRPTVLLSLNQILVDYLYTLGSIDRNENIHEMRLKTQRWFNFQ